MKPNLRLKAEIVRQGKKPSDVSIAIKMPKYTFSRKLNGHYEFTESEINSICQYLNVSPVDIFFDKPIAKTATLSA